MANVNQIYQIVNDASRVSLGGSAVEVLNSGSLVSLGDVVMSSKDNKEKFYDALTDRIGRTVIAIREYSPKKRAVMRDEMQWGIVRQKISFKDIEAVENPTWERNQVNPFDIEIKTEAIQKLFSVMSTWSYEEPIPDEQLFTAFTSASAMGAFISGIYTNIYNAMARAEENTANMAVNTYMGKVALSNRPSQFRDLLSEYNTMYSTALTRSEALSNTEFLKFASREINTVVSNMKGMSKIYNSEGISRFTPDDKMVVEVLGQFASATASYLQADTYHKELVKLPNYEEIAYWQGPGENFGFDDVSSIKLRGDTYEVEADGIIAFVHDYDSVASIIYKRRSSGLYNPRSEQYNIYEKADIGYAVDMSENGVVFTIGGQVSGYDEDEGGSPDEPGEG